MTYTFLQRFGISEVRIIDDQSDEIQSISVSGKTMEKLRPISQIISAQKKKVSERPDEYFKYQGMTELFAEVLKQNGAKVKII